MSKAARNRFVLMVALALALGGTLRAQEEPISTIDELIGRDLALLQQADERLQSGATSEAIDILLSLEREQGDKLVLLPGPNENSPFRVYVTLREAMLRRLARDRDAVMELRKRLSDAASGETIRPGRLNLNALSPRVGELWLAKADESIRLGAWNVARDYLTSFIWSAMGSDVQNRRAERLARLIYNSLLEGSPRRAKQERDSLAEQFRTARGLIAGREEVLLERADAWIAEFAKQEPHARRWSDTRLSFGIEPKGGVVWKRELTSTSNATGDEIEVAAASFPAFVDGWMFLSTGEAIYAWSPDELKAASGAWPAALYRATIKPDRAAPPQGAMRNVVSSSEGIAFARVGANLTRKRTAVPVADLAPGVLVTHDTARGGVLLSGFPMTPGLEEEFDGPPLVSAGKMFVAVRKRDETRTQLIVRCIDVTTQKLIWERPICNAETRGRGLRDEASQTMLLLDGDRLYVAPHLGCVASLDAASGGVRWITRYPRAAFPTPEARAANRWDRGLGAMHLRGDSLVVLAADCERVFALDGLSGELKWASRRELMNDAVYVIGATEEEVVLMGQSVYWLNAANGQVKGCYPERWVNVGQGQVDPHAAYGRGIWAGDSVWYPAREAILKVAPATDGKVQVTTELPLPQRSSLFGNLAYFDGRLYWASQGNVIAWETSMEKYATKKPPRAAK